MNPGLLVKLRPNGPWRIGPDSGARNRVDAIYHSDSLYSAITSAMARFGSLEEWLDATARRPVPAVSFSSCFPFLDEIGFVVPPHTIWPPASPAMMSSRVRWKSARFVPLGVVESMLAGRRLEDNQWTIDGPSECLVPAGRPGPFRTSVRWSAAVDRLSGAAERHSAACIEFRPGAGLWTIAGFENDAARERWLEPVKAAFRLLADTGFGGERSRGWGRSEAPEFTEGTLPEMILTATAKPAALQEPAEAAVREPSPVVNVTASPEPLPEAAAPAEENPGVPELPAEPVAEAAPLAQSEPPAEAQPEPLPESAAVAETEPAAGPAPESEPETPVEPEAAPAPESEPEPVAEAGPPAVPEPLAEAAPGPPAIPEPEPPAEAAAVLAPPELPPDTERPHWLLSVYTPSPTDSVDWRRGHYTLIARSGRIDSPAGSGELKKQLQMVAEGSVLYAASSPCGSAPDVAPDGFPHPVYRAGFALSIPLPEVS